jgi:ABC-type phosphate/phosphonate transport system substrate-binding protein
MQAALPMYLAPRDALQAFWEAVARLLRADAACAGLDIPQTLHWPNDVHAHWQASDLLLSQACGFPLVTLLAGRVQLVGTFAYQAPGVQGIYCRSQLICRAGDARQTLAQFGGSTLARNDTLSQSGYNALRALLASTTTQHPFFAHELDTGAHYRSIEAVRTGQADMAAIDPVSHVHWLHSHPESAGELRVFGQTEAYPGLPLITALQTPAAVVNALRRALHSVAHDASFHAVRAPLLITGFDATGMADYQVCSEMRARW